jgi:hypothetical protein
VRTAFGACVGAMIATVAIACTSFDEPPAAATTADGGDAASGGDGAGLDDANGDVVTLGDGGACTPAPSGCAGRTGQILDWTKSDFPPVGWEKQEKAGTLAYVAEGGRCSPGFLRATATIPADTSATAEAALVKSFNGSFAKIRLAFAFRGPQPVDGYANIGCGAIFRPVSGSTIRSVVRLTLSDGKLSFGGTVRDDSDAISSAVPGDDLDQAFDATKAGQWHTIDARMTVTSTLVTVSTAYDGQPQKNFDVPLLEPSENVGFECGLGYADGAGASYQHDVDDIFVELCPP